MENLTIMLGCNTFISVPHVLHVALLCYNETYVVATVVAMDKRNPKLNKSNKQKSSRVKPYVVRNVFDLYDLLDEMSAKEMDIGFPDILKDDSFLQSLVESIEEDPRLFYDEQYALTKRSGGVKACTYNGESFIKIVIHKLRCVLLEPANPARINTERKVKAKEWIEKFFDAAKLSIIKDFEFIPGAPKKDQSVIEAVQKA